MSFVFAIVVASVVPAAADPEVHVVGIYEGFTQSGNLIHGPKARVRLDRPGAEVILVLSSYDATLWELTLADGTAVPEVVLSQRVGGRQSEVMVNGKRLESPDRRKVPMVYRPEGIDFRALVELVPDLFGVDQMASFSGDYTAPDRPFRITKIVDDPRYGPDPLRAYLSTADLPDVLQALVGPGTVEATPDVLLTDAGFQVLTDEGAPRIIPLPLEMPAVSWARGAVRDAEARTLYGVTFGGDGYLYAYDETTAKWRIARSMDGLDAQACSSTRSGAD